MSKLHQILAVEKTRVGQAQKLLEDTARKFGKSADYFTGFTKSLSLLADGDSNDAIEAQAFEERNVVTTVPETLEYLLDFYAKAEDVLYQKAMANQLARADVILNGQVFLKQVPVEELLNLETRLTALRNLFTNIPTLNSNVSWNPDPTFSQYGWRARTPEITTKTEKVLTPVIMSPATDKHPAQVERVTKDEVVGRFTRIVRSGAATPQQKAALLEQVDELIIAVKEARMTANTVDVPTDTIGKQIADLLMSKF